MNVVHPLHLATNDTPDTACQCLRRVYPTSCVNMFSMTATSEFAKQPPSAVQDLHNGISAVQNLHNGTTCMN